MRTLAVWLLSVCIASCTDPVMIDTGIETIPCLAVDGMVTDQLCRQWVRLSTTEDFFSPSTEIPAVSGAVIQVSCGNEVFVYEEDASNPGSYLSTTPFAGVAGRTYRVDIDASVHGVAAHYWAEDIMPELGFQLDSIDYAYSDLVKDLWTIAIWGKDRFKLSSRYLAQVGINNHFKPFDQSYEIPDDHFDGMTAERFTALPLKHTMETWRAYGECCKPLEAGDVVSVRVSSLSEGYGEYLSGYFHFITGTIPILTDQPTNLATNVHSSEPVVGYFGACAVCEASCVVGDPFKKEYRR